MQNELIGKLTLEVEYDDFLRVWFASVWITAPDLTQGRAAVRGCQRDSREDVIRRCIARARQTRRDERRPYTGLVVS